jgi:EmrB/QacA subfamily drug resistance transporter
MSALPAARAGAGPLWAASAATAILLLDVTVVYLASPAIGTGLDASFTELQWVIDAYALTMAATLLPAGALADRLGRRVVFLAGLAIFAAGSVACATAQSAPWLDLARALQGLGAAGLFATSLALIAAAYEGHARARALGVWGAVSGVALAAGPVVGGVVVEGLGWRWIFWLNLPAAAAIALIALRSVPESRRRDAPAVDLAGAVLFGGSLLLLVGALLQGNERGWSSPEILAALAGSVAAMAAFALRERRASEPMLEPGLFRTRIFSATAAVTVLQSVAIYPVLLFLALELQGVFGFDALEAGVRILPVTAALLVVAPIAGRLTHRVPLGHLLAVGLAGTAGGLLLAHGAEVADGWESLLPGMVVMGLGLGVLSPALAAAIIAAVPGDSGGFASGIGNTFRQAGIALGIAVFGVVFRAATPDEPALAEILGGGGAATPAVALHFHDGVQAVLIVAAAIAAVGMLVAPLVSSR